MMTASILGKRFVHRDSGKPIWHGIRHCEPRDMTAVEGAIELGEYKVEKVPLTVEVGGKRIESGYYALMREPIPEDDEWRVFGSPVTDDFEVINVREAAELWDRSVLDAAGKRLPIETMGILGKGERLFISAKLPAFRVQDSEVETYMLFDDPLENNIALGCYTTGIHVVCQNTLQAAIGSATNRLQLVTHSKGAKEAIAKWLTTTYANAMIARGEMDESFNLLARKRVTLPQIKWIAANTYPMPPQPELEAPGARLPYSERLKQWQMACYRAERLREKTVELAEGAGTGMSLRACAGTAFGIYNAVAEVETYRRGKIDAVVAGLINGARGNRIRNAFTLAMNVDRFETLDADALGLTKEYV